MLKGYAAYVSALCSHQEKIVVLKKVARKRMGDIISCMKPPDAAQSKLALQKKTIELHQSGRRIAL